MIVSIYLATAPGEPLTSAAAVDVATGSGIVGDRNFGRSDYPGQNITFIESEALARFNSEHGQAADAASTRRNVVTSGVDLNALVGREFVIGNARFRGVELCTPCASLGATLATPELPPAAVVKAFLTSGGLRADVIRGGRIAVGMAFEEVPRPGPAVAAGDSSID